MKKVFIVGCGAYMDAGYGCPGEWRCLKAAATGEGNFTEPVAVTAFVRCECPGRTIIPNIAMTSRVSGVKPDAIYLSKCLAESKPGCPYTSPADLAALIEGATGIPVVMGTHKYQV